MGNITLTDVTAEQLVAMGDGALIAGDYNLAQSLFGAAFKRAAPELQCTVRVRLGLASTPKKSSPAMVKILSALVEADFGQPFVSEGMATWFKTLPFAEDAKFLHLADKHAHLLPIANWHWNLKTALWAVERSQHVDGDFVELGVFKGHTTLFCAEYVGFQAWDKRWWLYDTFEGIPADQQADGWAERNSSLYEGTFSHEEVQARFAAFPNIDVIKGRVPEILSACAPDKIAFMHVDMNNAPAEIAALDELFDRVSPGGAILFDDYCWASAHEQHMAENAWFAARGFQILPIPTGQGLFIKL